MRRKSLAMLFVTMLTLSTVLLMVSPVAAAPILMCEVSPKSGPVFTPVTVSGVIDPAAAGHDISIYWDVATGTPIATAVTLSDGTFEADFNVPATPAGVHSVIGVDTDTGAHCSDTFKVVPQVVMCPCLCVEYCDLVDVYGTGFLAYSKVEWRVGSYGSGFDAWASGDADTDETGSWSTTFHVENVEPGVYLFQARDKEEHCIRAKAEFMVGPLLLLDRDHGQPCEYIAFEGCLPDVCKGTTVYVYFEIPESIQVIDCERCLDERILVGTTEISSLCGYFDGVFHVPFVPTLGPHPYRVIATDEYETVLAEAWFWVCPCVVIEPTEGQVGDEITVYGYGYSQLNIATVWMSGLLPTDIPLEVVMDLWPLMNLVWAWDETNTWLILTVGYFLPVATAPTDCYGNFEVTFEIPECWGGYHPIVATTYPVDHCPGVANVIGGWWICYGCPVFPDGILCLDECATVVNKPGILRVLPKIWTDPDSGVSGQTITLYGQGLSAFEFYVWYTDINHNKCPDICEFGFGETYVYKRCSGFVLDFGPNKRWIDGPYFPYMFLDYATGHFILNGQYDGSWSTASWPSDALAIPMWGCPMFSPPYIVLLPPVDRYSPLMLNPRGTLVSEGMSYSTTINVDYFGGLFDATFAFAWEYRQVGCPFLTVPWLQPQCCELVAYRFDYIEIEFHAQWPGTDIVDLSLEFFTYDYDETATTCFEIEPLQVDAGVDFGEILSRLDELEANIAGLIADAEGNIVAEIETTEGNIVAELSALDAKITGLIADAEGNIVAEIETALGTIQADLTALGAEITGVVTDSEGNIVAEIETALGTVQADLTALDAKLVSLDDIEVTIETALGPVKASLDDLNTYVTVDITNRLATIETDLGTLEGKLVTMEGKMATIETDVGTITTKTDLIVNHTGSMPVTIALSLIAAIAAIAAAVLILRKVYIA